MGRFLKWTAAAVAAGLVLQGLKLYLERQGQAVDLELGVLGFVAVYALALISLLSTKPK
ncbi:hypothetical protein [Calidithermus timidus]|uniref:hypothetical protein n=1 Tax=Calidithermus timidus TaxID=307124 RepID=UPI0003A219B5|nr:hypothetical protein [Calidithermus timidus]